MNLFNNITVYSAIGYWRAAYEQLKAEEFGQLYYIKSNELTGNDHEASLDGSLYDIGHLRMAGRIGKEIGKILKQKPIN